MRQCLFKRKRQKRLNVDKADPWSLELAYPVNSGRVFQQHLGAKSETIDPPTTRGDHDVEPEPAVGLSEFLARQRLDDSSSLAHPRQDDDDDDVDHTLAAVTSAPSSAPVKPRKNQVHTVEWDFRPGM
ncbi:hypothetical protein M422DRAFT_245378 [Sphaerobolus stellatus SS14]|nr:hypothetical protein M422DRAFT_245378 [Sphaerobolus stellatus SS14]